MESKATVKNIHDEKQYYHIKLSLTKSVMILAIKIYNSLLCCKKTKKKAKDLTTRDRLLKLYQKGRERYEKDLSIDRIIRNLRNLRILFVNES